MKCSLSVFFIACAMALGSGATVMGQTSILVPNGDFSDPDNAGTIGGQLLQFGTVTNTGDSPWTTRSTGVLGLLLSPTVTIGDGPTGTLSFQGVATTSGLLATRSDAFVSTATAFMPNSIYVLEFDYAAVGLVDLSLLASVGFEVNLTAGGTTTDPGTEVASNINTPTLLDLGLLEGNGGRATLTYTTGAIAPTGDIGVRFAIGEGSGLVNASVLSNITIDNVTLTVTPVPEPGSLLLVSVGTLLMLRRSRRKPAMASC